MRQRYTLKKTERLKSRKAIETLFREGKSFSLFPFKIFYLLTQAPPASAGGASPLPRSHAPLQAGFGVSARLFRKAVDRNRIKRLSREAWRLQRHPLAGHLQKKDLCMTVFIIYTGKQLPDHTVVTQKIGVALHKLMRDTA
jgi:ribonuclease P protein component